MSFEIRQAKNEEDIAQVSSILHEAAMWLNSISQPLWQCDELALDKIADEVRSGFYFMALMDGEAAGVMKFQFEDKLFWPDISDTDSAFIHRLAVRRKYAGTGLSGQILGWAKKRAKQSGRKFLRLDCVPRPKLCAFYECHGFIKHSERQVGPYYVFRYEYNIENCELPYTSNTERDKIP